MSVFMLRTSFSVSPCRVDQPQPIEAGSISPPDPSVPMVGSPAVSSGIVISPERTFRRCPRRWATSSALEHRLDVVVQRSVDLGIVGRIEIDELVSPISPRPPPR